MMKYQHVLCLYPYYAEPSFLDFFPPAGIEHVATALEGYVGEITLIDLKQEKEYRELSTLTQFISQHIDLMCVSVNWHFHFDQVCNLINYLPAGIPLVVGGRQATERMEELFQRCPHIDIIVRGEGEETIREIAQDKDLTDILGISYRKDGQIKHNPNRPLPSIETIRYPNRRLRRTPYYIRPRGIQVFQAEFDSIFSSRGCPYNCKFCTFMLNPLGQRRRYSARTPESVVEEIKGLKAKVIYFEDEDFFVDPGRTERICDLLIEQDIQKIFIGMSRIDIVRYPARLFKKLEKAGFKAILLGIESPHDKILQQFGKGFNSQNVREALQTLHNYPFYYHGLFIYGNIGENREEMLSIPRFAKEIGVDSIYAQPLQQRKFSPIKEIVEKTPGYYLNSEGFVCSDECNIDELRRIGKTINKRFYTPYQLYKMIRKLYKIRVLTLSSPLVFVPLVPRLLMLLYEILTQNIRKRRGRKRIGIPYA